MRENTLAVSRISDVCETQHINSASRSDASQQLNNLKGYLRWECMGCSLLCLTATGKSSIVGERCLVWHVVMVLMNLRSHAITRSLENSLLSTILATVQFINVTGLAQSLSVKNKDRSKFVYQIENSHKTILDIKNMTCLNWNFAIAWDAKY